MKIDQRQYCQWVQVAVAADVVVAELKKILPLLTEFDSDLESSYQIKRTRLKVDVNHKNEATQQAPNIYNICNFTIKLTWV